MGKYGKIWENMADDKDARISLGSTYSLVKKYAVQWEVSINDAAKALIIYGKTYVEQGKENK